MVTAAWATIGLCYSSGNNALVWSCIFILNYMFAKDISYFLVKEVIDIGLCFRGHKQKRKSRFALSSWIASSLVGSVHTDRAFDYEAKKIWH